MKNKICKLSDLKIGQEAKIISVKAQNKVIRKHLLDMGMIKGTIVRIEKIAPMGDPIDISLRGYELCIRKLDLERIEVEMVEDCIGWKSK